MSKVNQAVASQHVIEGEKWRPVPKLEESFEVSNFSRVRNKNTGTILNPQMGGSKYMFFMLYDKKTKIRVKKYLHRLVALCFVPNPYKCHEVNHIDGNKMNNAADNLEWVTPSQNQLHAIQTGLRRTYFRVGDTNGEKNAASKLTWAMVDEIRAWYAEQYRTTKDLIEKGKEYNVGYKTIFDVVKERKWKTETRNL